MDGITKDTQLESWSMGKSITATLFALLVKDGTYTLEQPAPVPRGRSRTTRAREIRNIDLLRMSGGLKFLANQEPEYAHDKGYPDHFYIYTGAVDSFSTRSTARCSSRRTPEGAIATAIRSRSGTSSSRRWRSAVRST